MRGPVTRASRIWLTAAIAAALAVPMVATSAPAGADPNPPWDGTPISAGLGPTYGETWCADAAPGTNIATQQEFDGDPFTDTLALMPQEAIGCTLEGFLEEAQTAGIPERMSYEVIGRSFGGRDLYGVVVNALETPEQQRDYDRWVRYRTMVLTDPVEAQQLLASWGDEVKLPIFIEANIHGGEEEGTDAIMQVIRDLVTTPYGEHPLVDELLDHTILVVIPSQNPDGRFAGTRANGGGLDMNRDFLVQSQPEVRANVAFQLEWLAPVMLAMHGYVNPTLVDGLTKPHNPGLEYDLFVRWNQPRLDANEAAYEAIQQGITRPVNDYGSNGGQQANITSTGANQVGTTVTITTTGAHGLTVGQEVRIAGVGAWGYDGTFTVTAVPTPTTFTYETTAGLPASGFGVVFVGNPEVAEGWDDWGPFYTQTYSAFFGVDGSTLEMCSNQVCGGRFGSKRAQYVGFYSSAEFWTQHRAEILMDQSEIFRRGVAGAPRPNCCDDPLVASRGFTEEQHNWMVPYPKAYVIPFEGTGQRSDAEANRMARWLLDNGISVHRTTKAFSWKPQGSSAKVTIPERSYVVWMDQPLRGLALTALDEGQDVSERISVLYAPPGAWSHGLLWGADTLEVAAGDKLFKPTTTPISSPNALKGGVRNGTAEWYAVTLRGALEVRAIVDLLEGGVDAELAEEPFVTLSAGTMPAGSLIFPNDPATRAALHAAGQAVGIWFERGKGPKPPTTQVDEEPDVAVLVNSATPTRNDTLNSLERLFGPGNVRFVSVVSGADSLQNAPTDPLADVDVIYNLAQNYPSSTNATARSRLQDFFARGGGYIGTSVSGTNFTFLTTGGLLASPLTQGSDTGADGGIAIWDNAGGPLTGGYPSRDYLFLDNNITYFAATPPDAVIDGRYLPSTTDMFVAGLWRNRNPAVAGAPMAVHGVTTADSRYAGLAANPFSRMDAEREWPWVGQAALWTNLTDEA